MNAKMNLESFSFDSVRLLPGLFAERAAVSKAYLMSLDTTALLQNFYLEAGIIIPGYQVIDDPARTKLHWGWEAPVCQLRGHFLGHWLSAAAMHVASEKDKELGAKLDVIIEELARCQKLNGGKWVGSIPEKYFTKLETSDYVWSPQYVLHKTIMGLFDAHRLTANKTALFVLDGLTEWYKEWTDSLCERGKAAVVYKGESGGMLELWAALYSYTKKEVYKTLAERYADHSLFGDLLAHKDPLSNSHANASIPLAHGAARMYEATGEERWLTITERFWDCAVNERESFCTGGQNAGEFWIPPQLNARFLGERNQEFCTVYNMVRLADYLFRFTGKVVYADYIERALYNGFLSQQNKNTGMPTYFLPLLPGSHKKWGTPTRDFWCCHGTMVQAQAYYPALCYYAQKESRRLVVSQYIPSELFADFGGETVHLTQNTGMKYYNDQAFFDESDTSQMSRSLLTICVESKSPLTLALRLPSWVQGEPRLTVNEKPVVPTIKDGFIELTVSGTVHISLFLEAAVRALPLSGEERLEAFAEGPIVLAGLCTGDAPIHRDASGKPLVYPRMEHTYGTFPWQQSTYSAHTVGGASVRMVPLYEVTDEPYTVYFHTDF